MAFGDYLASEIAHDFGDGLLTRREALRRLGLFGMTAAAAGALLAACASDSGSSKATAPTGGPSPTSGPSSTSGPSPTSGPGSPGEPLLGTHSGPGTGTARSQPITFPGDAGPLQGAFAAPPQANAGVLVIHENRGLQPHFVDLVGRLANEGMAALCVDLLSRQGGTATFSDPAAAPAALAAAPTEQLVADLRRGIDELERRVPGKKLGVVGFCFGGGMTWSLLAAGEQRLAAAVPFYGPTPSNPDFRRAKAAVLAVYGELDARVNAGRAAAEAALTQAGLEHTVRVYPGADHAFFNDTGTRYNEGAARQAYSDMLDWFRRHLS